MKPLAVVLLFTCLSPALPQIDQLGHALAQNHRGLALVAIQREMVRVIPFDAPEFRRCTTTELVTPVIAEDGSSLTWLSGKQIITQTFEGRLSTRTLEAGVSDRALGDTAAARVSWTAVVPHHPDAIAYATLQTQHLGQRVTFDATSETAAKLGWPAKHFVREHATLSFAPAWSPDGKELIFSSFGTDQATGKSSNAIYVWNIVTGETNRIAPGVSPSWSPDGQWIAYMINHGPERPFEGQAWLANAKTGVSRKLFEFDNLDSSVPLRWSPDGRYLLFGNIVQGTMAANSEDVISVYRLEDGATKSMGQFPRENLVSRGPYWIVQYHLLERSSDLPFSACKGK